jgi:hypothetical protein
MAHEHRFKLAYRHDAYQCRFSNEITCSCFVVATMKRLGGIDATEIARAQWRELHPSVQLRPALPTLFISCALSQSHSGAATVLVDEVDAGRF